MGGEFYLQIRRSNAIDQLSGSNALVEMVHLLQFHFSEIFDDDIPNEYSIGFDSQYAFEFEDSVARWSNGSRKSFRILWKWGPDAVESKLGGRNRGDWSVVRFVCEFLCDKFAGELALVVADGFSGYNDDMGEIFYDGQCEGYMRCSNGEWPLSNEPFNSVKQSFNDKKKPTVAGSLVQSQRNDLAQSQRRFAATDDDSDVDLGMLMELMRLQSIGVQGSQSRVSTSDTDTLARERIKRHIRRRDADQKNRNNTTSSAEAESVASHSEREAAAQRMAAQLIRDEEAEKERAQKKKAKKNKATGKGGRLPEQDSSPSSAGPDISRVHAAQAKQADESKATEDAVEAHAGDGWAAPKARRGARAERPAPRDMGAWMMQEWKTRQCLNEEAHNWTLCQHFHAGGTDQRRNPFVECYLPEQAANKVEELYHPLRFRTQLCARRACGFREPYVCSFAHSERDLRAMAETEYLALFAGSAAAAASLKLAARLGDFLDPQALAPAPAGADPGAPPPTEGAAALAAGGHRQLRQRAL
jgi:hypothetical protein